MPWVPEAAVNAPSFDQTLERQRCRFKDALDGLSEDESEDEPETKPESAAKKSKPDKDPDLAALEGLGYKSGPSVLLVPDRTAAGETSWEW